MTRSINALIPLLTMLVVLAGCSDENFVAPEEGSDGSAEANGLNAETDPVGLDAQLVRLAEAVPGFGGLFYDDDGNMNVYLNGLGPEAGPSLETRRAEVARALTEVLGADVLSRGHARRTRSTGGGGARSEVTLLEGQYDLLQLAQWRSDLRSVLSRSDVVLLDLAEEENRVRVGVAPGTPSAEVRSELASRSIPEAAVLIEEVEPVAYAFTIQDRIRPAVGATQVQFGGFLCTLGFNATRGGTRGFLTNSHCTNVRGGAEGTVYYQPVTASGNRIGVEQHDPLYFTGGACPVGRRCRYSDTGFARYDGGVSSRLGKLARVTGNGTTGGGSGSLTIQTGAARYTVVSETPFPASGETLDKIGRTTGHTYGIVGSTCVDTNVSGEDITMLCQDFVDGAGVGGGDSGSPVFRWDASGNISLYGILWGSSGGSTFVFSALDMTERTDEMGPLTTF